MRGTMRVRWTEDALASLKNETEYVRRNNAKAACRVISSIRRSVDGLSVNPHLGRKCVYKTRELISPEYPFVIWYAVAETCINILLVKHMTRDFGDAQKLRYLENVNDEFYS